MTNNLTPRNRPSGRPWTVAQLAIITVVLGVAASLASVLVHAVGG